MLSNVEVGDTLLWVHGLVYNQKRTLVSVERITETQIVTKVSKFRKRDGKEVGFSDSFSRSYVRQVTEEEIVQLKGEMTRATQRNIIDNFFCLQEGAKVLEDEDAKQIVTIIQKYTKK